MKAPLSADALARISDAVRGPRGRELMALMRDAVVRPTEALGIDSLPTRELCESLGLLEPGGKKPTLLGVRIGGTFKEFLFWEERGRKMPRADWAPALREERFRDREVLEIGCGLGCHLFTLQPVARRVIGVEIDPAIVQMCPILAAVAGRPAPEIVEGRAERLPLPSGSVDEVLSLSSMQYMRIEEALSEAARVLRPGGRIAIKLTTFAGIAGRVLSESLPSLEIRQALVDSLHTVEALAYCATGRRFRRDGRPIHLPVAAMRAKLMAAGFAPSSESRVHGREVVHVAVRR